MEAAWRRRYVLVMASGRLRRLDDDLFAGRLTRRPGFLAARSLLVWTLGGALLGLGVGWPLMRDPNGCFGCFPVPVYTAALGGAVGVVVALTRITVKQRRDRRARP